jgi:hypothetical protein
MNTEHHHNFKNHFSQLILYSYNYYYGLTALTLVSNTVPNAQVHLSTRRPLCSFEDAVHIKVGTHCNVTAYRNTVSWQCGRDSWPRNVSRVDYAVTLWACSVRCRYLAVASKGWYGYGLSRYGRSTWHVTTVRSSRLLYNDYASGSRNKLRTPRCNARRILLRHEARDESSDCNCVSCQSLATLWRCGTR